MYAQQSTQGTLDAIAYVAWHSIRVRVVIHDEENEPVFEGTFDYALRPRKT